MTGSEARPLLAVGGDEQTKQTAAQREAALKAFDGLHLREVEAKDTDTAATFLARFQSTAASLGLEERIRLKIYAHESGMEVLKAVLADPQAGKICALHWNYRGKEDVNLIIPLLINSCPELASLKVSFEHHSALDFVSSVLEHPGTKIKVLRMPYAKGDISRFFAALRRSQVSALTLLSIGSPEVAQGLCEYLAKDLLVRLTVWYGRPATNGMIMLSLENCARLAQLDFEYCKFSQPTTFPSITKLAFSDCTFVGSFDWSFLADSNVQELSIQEVSSVDGRQFGGALAVHLKAKGLGKLCFHDCDFVTGTLAAVGVEIGRIKRLVLKRSYVNDASIALIALALKFPSSEMKELTLEYFGDLGSSLEDHLVPALRHPNCSLAKLSLSANPEHRRAAKAVEDRFRNRRALFVLLQGRQGRRLRSPLRRLPVEMFRLVGEVLV